MTLQLHKVRVEGFRGLRSLEVEFSSLTVLLGESRVGKTSLLDSLERCLGVGRTARQPPFGETDFARGSDGQVLPINVTVEFVGDCSDAVLEELAWDGRGGQRHLVLRVSATDPTAARWAFLGSEGQVIYDEAPASLCDRLRALHPVLLIDADRYSRSVPMEGQSGAEAPSMFHRLFARRGALTAQELREGLDMLQGAVDSPGDRVFLGKRRATARLRDIVEAPGRLRAIPGELLDSLRSAGTQSLALFLLVAFLLEVRAGEAMVEGAVPILAIEEPELRLHPTVAASLWGVLELLPGQKVITTNSPELLRGAPLHALRRLQRRDGDVTVHYLRRKTLGLEELRRIAFHLRLQQGGSLFARCWLLVEGESEVWLLSELARQCGYVLPAEGVACLTFAQCGLLPIILLADDLGIDWHVMVDGDEAGLRYVEYARERLNGRPEEDRITLLTQPNVETYMWSQGYADVYRRAAGDLKPKKRGRRRQKGKRRGYQQRDVIKRAIRASSKPGLALRVAVAASREGGPGVPPQMRHMFDIVVGLARDGRAPSPLPPPPIDPTVP